MLREPEEQALHDHVVRLLYRDYYRYPSPSHLHLLTFANHPLKHRAVRDDVGTEHFPDVVVVHSDTGRLVMVAEVETESTINETEADEWRSFAGLAERFYLYVPRGYGPRAVQLCQGCRVTEFVEYHREAGKYVLRRFA
jgi:hypothetical protein